MAEKDLRSQVEALLKPVEPAVAQAYFEQVRTGTSHFVTILLWRRICVSSATDSGSISLLQIIQDLGVPLSIRETSDSKGRGVFCSKVAFTVHKHQRCTIKSRIPRRNAGCNTGRSPCSIMPLSR